ncbi:MAG: hypothetical protein E7A62_06415 [Actinomycetaceae bacterium]|nr:hypothetical protein [Actinomycetaceae bacterium]MDU0970614.1 hypothetical protein [Actinomycetaceae bacterium]
MMQSDVYTATLAQEMSSTAMKWTLAVAFAIVGAILTIAGIALSQTAIVTTGGLIVALGGFYAAIAAFNRALSDAE